MSFFPSSFFQSLLREPRVLRGWQGKCNPSSVSWGHLQRQAPRRHPYQMQNLQLVPLNLDTIKVLLNEFFSITES